MANPKRKGLSKKIRFEVFKRDTFKCQYCGASAPNVLLRVDHIKPVSKGGKDSIVNYITACFECNAGKSDRELTDSTVLEKQRVQLEALQERREQLEMMMEWSQGLTEIQNDVVAELAEKWKDLAPGFGLSEHGLRNLRKWTRKFSLEAILFAMPIAADHYLRYTKDGAVTNESWNEAFLKIPGIIVTEHRKATDQDLEDLNKIRAMIRNKCGYFSNWECMDWLRAARSWEVPIEELRQLAYRVNSWTSFKNKISTLIDEYRGEVDA